MDASHDEMLKRSSSDKYFFTLKYHRKRCDLELDHSDETLVNAGVCSGETESQLTVYSAARGQSGVQDREKRAKDRISILSNSNKHRVRSTVQFLDESQHTTRNLIHIHANCLSYFMVTS